jgi:hypothetical protein
MPKKGLDDFNFDEDFGDIFEGTREVAKPASTPVVPASTPVVPASTPVVPTDTNASGGTNESPVKGTSTVSFGKTVSNVPVTRFKGQKDFKARIALVWDQVQTVKLHYVQGIGSFVCFGGKCCDLEGLPRVRYLIPVIQYNTDRNGKIIDDNIELKTLAIGAETYSALADVITMSGRGVTEVDIIVSCSDEQYQKLTFAADNSKGITWPTFPKAKELYKYFKEHRNDLYQSVARNIDESSYLTKKGFVTNDSPAVTVAPVSRVEDLLE